MSLLPLATDTWDARERDAIARVVASNRFTYGPEVAAFEAEFAAAFGARRAVFVNSGSSANLLATAALVHHDEIDLGPGDEVIVPAVSWSTTYFPFAQHGIALRFVDVDPETLNMDPAVVEAALTPRTRAVCAVNLLGNPCRLDALRDLCDGRGLTLMEDNCESMGAELGGRAAGAFGRAGTFSTFFSHHISTMEGGVVVTDDEHLHHLMLSLRSHGWLREQPPDSRLNVDVDPFSRTFRFVLPGYNLRPIEMAGAIGREQLRKLPDLVAARRRNAATFQGLFADADFARIQSETGRSSWFGFALTLAGPLAGRREAVAARLGEIGVEVRPIVAGNFVRNPVMARLEHSVHGSLEAADRIDRDGLFFGNHHYDVSEPLARIRETLGELARAV